MTELLFGAGRGVLHLADLRDPPVAEQVLLLAGALQEAHGDLALAGPVDPRTRRRLTRLGLRWVSLELSPERAVQRAASRQLSHLLETRQPALLHVHGLTALRVAAAALSPLPVDRRPLLFGSLYAFPGPRVSPALLAPCARLLLDSSSQASRLAQRWPRLAARLRVLYPALAHSGRPSSAEAGVLRRRFGLSGQAAVVGLATTFAEREWELFLEAASHVHALLPNVEFALLGEGPRQADARALAHRLRLTGVSVFLGTPASLADALSTLNTLVLLSDAGGAHLFALQALDYGVPVIAADQGALAELLRPLPGTALVPPDSLEDLVRSLRGALHVLSAGESFEAVAAETGRAASLDQFLVSREFYDLDQPWGQGASWGVTRSGAGREALRSFSPESVAARLWALYQEALDA